MPNTNEATGLLSGVTKLVNLLATGRGLKAIVPRFCVAPLTAFNANLAKPDGEVRPVAVGETLRKLFSSCLLARISSEAR